MPIWPLALNPYFRCFLPFYPEKERKMTEIKKKFKFLSNLILGFSQKKFQAPGGESHGKNWKKLFPYENHAISASKPKGAILLA